MIQRKGAIFEISARLYGKSVWSKENLRATSCLGCDSVKFLGLFGKRFFFVSQGNSRQIVNTHGYLEK